MHTLELEKPDGRRMTLYSRRPIVAPPGTLKEAPSPGALAARPHFRWHPLRGEWVAYATHRQDRTFLPPPDYDPLAPTRDPAFPTELPAGDYDAAVFENLFPAMVANATDAPALEVPTLPGRGHCEVVVFTPDPEGSLGALPVDRIQLVLEIWADRTRRLAKERPEIRYVMPFENRGIEMGVTLAHPHGQIYAYPFIPPIAERELALQAKHLAETGHGLLARVAENELRDGRRILHEADRALAFVPAFARYPYETWVLPRRPVARLTELDSAELLALARALKTVLMKYDALWKQPFPYLLVVHQAPLDGQPHPEAHVHFELYPAYRARGKLKFLAGTELGAGLFVNDSLPEEKARELREVPE